MQIFNRHIAAVADRLGKFSATARPHTDKRDAVFRRVALEMTGSDDPTQEQLNQIPDAKFEARLEAMRAMNPENFVAGAVPGKTRDAFEAMTPWERHNFVNTFTLAKAREDKK